jgi:phosphatidylglycerol:prolipoprotein diacylglycerol transferase
MRQTLFHIPNELSGIPVFGMGWALGVWVLFGIALVIVLSRRNGWTPEVRGYVPLLVLVGLTIVFLLPRLEVRLPDGQPIGLPIRGYGAFVLAGILAGLGLSLRRARQVGIDPELIYSLALWLFVIAIAGARLFYIIQYWPDFRRDTPMETLAAMLQFTEGGLVVYGSVIGGILALYLFSRRHRVSMFELGDLIAPGMAIGSALGRIGCLMNGCCYGGVCEAPLAIAFPKYASEELRTFSPPYVHQLATGELYGFRFEADADGSPVVGWVEPGSAAANAGLQPGVKIAMINDAVVENFTEAQLALALGRPDVKLITSEATTFSWQLAGLPPRSLPVHPTQIYSAINGVLMCLVVWFAYPFRTRPGQILALLFILYSITRFLLEWIRSDEVGQWGTAFTISQLVSMMVLATCVGLWFYLLKQPPLEEAAT